MSSKYSRVAHDDYDDDGSSSNSSYHDNEIDHAIDDDFDADAIRHNAIELMRLASKDDDDNSVNYDEEEEEFMDEEDMRRLRNRARFSLERLEEQLLWNVWNRWEEPCLLSIYVSVFLLLPTLILWMFGAFAFVGRFWSIWIFVLLLQLRVSVSQWNIASVSNGSFKSWRCLRIVTSLMTLLEIGLLIFYHAAGKTLIEVFFRDIDGTIVYEWEREVRFIRIATAMTWIIILARAATGVTCITIRIMKWLYPGRYENWRPTYWVPNCDEEGSLSETTRFRLYRGTRIFNVVVLAFHLVCILSAVSHFGPWPYYHLPEECDSLDDTECAFPFPSFHHIKEDRKSPTGYRVHLRGLPPLKGGVPMKPGFLNRLDGFSTMAPMLFYIDGMKEAHENGDNRVSLQGPENIHLSVTSESITLLIDVEEQSLVHHSAEIDYLDPDRPLVMVFPAAPLDHGKHYAVAVIGARDENGRRLPPTRGMVKMMKATNHDHRTRTFQKLIPALQAAAPWYSFTKEPESLQLIFDFVTVSEQAQLGPIRAARDKALDLVGKWDWTQHLDVVAIEDQQCCDDCLIARTIHINLDVPSFLTHESRYAFLDSKKLKRRRPLTYGKAKAMVQIPCSVRNAEKSVQATVEFGHGLFYNRMEMTDHFLQRMAHENGYIMMGMDFRGMSSYDLPIVIKTLIGTPDLFEAVRDNLIQGFVNKLCLQHFAQNGMLTLDAFKFDGESVVRPDDDKPVSAYYGISQGGILGGGYLSLAGATNLIERGILGVPGTPFALILTRSLDFAGYDQLMLLNFYNNRHVRLLLSLVQMAWDSAEASGHRAGPNQEPLPRILMQAGLGDPVVPTIAAEAMARALGASTLPNAPRKIFGVSEEPAASTKKKKKNKNYLGPNVTLSELYYEKEASTLPVDDMPGENNRVHLCVRLDDAFVQQIEEFINTGRVIDPCGKDQCHRDSAVC